MANATQEATPQTGGDGYDYRGCSPPRRVAEDFRLCKLRRSDGELWVAPHEGRQLFST